MAFFNFFFDFQDFPILYKQNTPNAKSNRGFASFIIDYNLIELFF